jgi:hypothetical protein
MRRSIVFLLALLLPAAAVAGDWYAFVEGGVVGRSTGPTKTRSNSATSPAAASRSAAAVASVWRTAGASPPKAR